jgi:8-oxo-dGTP pyrophosphatase MutT (NUDIX family)
MENIPWRIGQYALISNSENELLILKRSKSQKWSLPGGRIESHERDWLESLKREVKEEAGIDIEDPKPFKVNIVEDLPYQIKYCVYFQVKLEKNIEVNITEEHSSFEWINIKNCDEYQFEYQFVQKLVADYLKNNGSKI